MKNLYKKLFFILFTAFTFPVLADEDGEDSKDLTEDTTEEKAAEEEASEEEEHPYQVILTVSKNAEGKKDGMLKFKVQVPWGDDTLHYTLNLLNMPPLGLIYESPVSGGHLNGGNTDTEKTLALLKKGSSSVLCR